MELYPIHFTRLQHVEFGQFITRLSNDINSLKLDLTADPEFEGQLDTLMVRNKLYSKALQQIIAQQETDELMELDRKRDFRISALRTMVAVYAHSDDAKELDAYKGAMLIMNKYQEIDSENYEAETKSIQLLLAEWKKETHKTTIEILHLQTLLSNLEKAAVEFDTKFDSRSAIVGGKELYDTKGIRKNMETIYRDLANDVLAMAKRKKTDFYTKLLDMVNNGRHYYADILAKRGGTAKGGDTQSPAEEK